MRGLDISHWQHGLNVAALDVDFVIAKATGGNGYVDPDCVGFIEQARQSGKLWGFYHFAKDGYASQDGRAEADFFISKTSDWWGKGLPVLDLEDNGIADWAAYTKAFIDRCYEVKKVYPVIYTGLQGISRLKSTDVLQKCRVWFAGYPLGYINYWLPETTTPSRYYSIDSAANIIVWQFTSAIPYQGFNCDANIAYINRIDWQILVKGEGEAKEVKERTVWQYKANMTDAQLWKPEWNKDGSFVLVNKACGLALDVKSASTKSGTPVQAYPKNGTPAQSWKLQQVKGKYKPAEVAPFELVPAVSDKLRLDVKGGSLDDKTAVQVYRSNGTLAQRWLVIDNGAGYWTLVNAKSGKVLDVKDGGK